MNTTVIVQVALAMMALGVALAFVRLVRGPGLPDRVVAFDLLSIQVLGIICGVAVLTGRSLLLDAAIILALLAFLATVAFARYVEKRTAARAGGDARA